LHSLAARSTASVFSWLVSPRTNFGGYISVMVFIGGLGFGFGYIVPVAVLVKWFSDRRGLITGVAVGGFGAGALITAPVASRLIQMVGVLPTFAYLGVGYFIIAIIAALFMQNPPEGWQPEGWTPTKKEVSQRAGHDFVLSEALKTWQWWVLWLILFLNTSAGIAVISQEAPIFQELTGVTAVVAGGMVGVASLGNGVGRIFWAWLSDLITRRVTFVVMFILQVGLFWFLPGITVPSVMTTITFIILMCYGGGFGTMPAFTADYFGPKNVGPIYGLMLTAWSFASVFGPLYIARMRETTGHYAGALHVIAAVMLISILLPIIVRPPRREQSV
jgi:MFS transporter, OFA family, oxalate/formate antiporter